jgi:hypothetical protein
MSDTRRWFPLSLSVVLSLAFAAPFSAAAQTSSEGAAGPWFGVMLPPGLMPHELQVISDRPAAPAVVPAGEERFTELGADALWTHLETIVGFAIESRESREIGSGQLWGRVTGLPSGNRTVEWAAERFREAGIDDVELQRFQQGPNAGIGLTTTWEVRVLGDPSFGAGTRDIVLESAMPLSPVAVAPLTAPLVYVGGGSPAELAHIDVTGKIAVQKAIPQGHTVFLRDPVGPRAEDLLARGAVAVLTIVDLPGNMRVRDMGCGGGLCINLGGRDGLFLERVLEEAALAGKTDAVRATVSVEAERRTGLSAANAVAVIPGATNPDEYIVLNAHADSWFDGAGDNGDGLAVLIGLARHFARPDVQLERSLVLVASAGHHSSGLSGPGNFVAMNPDVIDGAVLIVNLEHTSQRHIAPARSVLADGFREWTMDAHEAPIVAGITNESPFLEELTRRGIARYGTNFVSGPNTMASGEGGSYRATGVPVFTAMQGPPMYHTTGEVLEMVSAPGMERMARFMAFYVKEVSKALVSAIGPRLEGGPAGPGDL